MVPHEFPETVNHDKYNNNNNFIIKYDSKSFPVLKLWTVKSFIYILAVIIITRNVILCAIVRSLADAISETWGDEDVYIPIRY
jgi:hypothetical protein